MQHLQFKLRILLDFAFIEWNNIIVSDAQARSIKLKSRFLFSSDSYTQLALGIQIRIQQIKFMFAIQNRNNIDKALIQHHRDIVNILHFLATITYNIIVLLELTHVVQSLHQIQIEGGRSLQMHIIFQHFGQHKFKMRAFCTIAIVIIALIIGLRDSHIEPSSGLLDIL